MLGGSRVGGRLKWCLVRPQPWLLVDLRARIPKQNLRGDVAADWLAAVVEQGDAFLPGCVEQVVGLDEHRGDGQTLARLRRDLKLEGPPRPDVTGTARPDRSVGGAHMDDARLTSERFIERARRSILRQRLESLAAVRLAGREQRRAVGVYDVEHRRHSHGFCLPVGKLQGIGRRDVLDARRECLVGGLGRYAACRQQQRREHGQLESCLRHCGPPSSDSITLDVQTAPLQPLRWVPAAVNGLEIGGRRWRSCNSSYYSITCGATRGGPSTEFDRVVDPKKMVRPYVAAATTATPA